MQRGKTKFHEFHGITLPHFCYSRSKIVIIQTIFIGKHVESFEISLENDDLRKLIYKYLILTLKSKN